MRMQVRSLASRSGLRIRCCLKLGCMLQTWLGSRVAVAVAVASSCSSESTPSLGTSICCGCGSKKQKRKKRRKEGNINVSRNSSWPRKFSKMPSVKDPQGMAVKAGSQTSESTEPLITSVSFHFCISLVIPDAITIRKPRIGKAMKFLFKPCWWVVPQWAGCPFLSPLPKKPLKMWAVIWDFQPSRVNASSLWTQQIQSCTHTSVSQEPRDFGYYSHTFHWSFGVPGVPYRLKNVHLESVVAPGLRIWCCRCCGAKGSSPWPWNFHMLWAWPKMNK